MRIISAELPVAPQLDIMIPTHERLDLTMRSVQSIYFNTGTPFHLIICDASKSDLTQHYIQELCDSGVAPLGKVNNLTYIRYEDPNWKEGNQFFNVALRECKTDFMGIVMNSVRVEPEWELVALNLMKQDSQVGLIGFKCLFPNGLIESAGIKMLKYLPTDIGRDLPGHALSKVYEPDAVQWAFSMIRKSAGIGNLPEGIFHGHLGWDDIDNCFCLKAKGWKILYCGLGAGYHEPRASRGNNSPEAAQKNKENGEAFYKRWGLWDDFIKDHPDGKDIHAFPKSVEQLMGVA